MADENRSTPEPFRLNAAAVKTGLLAMLLITAGFIGAALVMSGRSLNESEVRAMIREAFGANTPASAGAASAISMVDDDPSIGPADAPVTIVEFSDFYCIHCISFATETLPQLQSHYGDQIRFVYRDMPITSGQAGIDAAVAGNCANDQNKFWEFHDIAFASPATRGAGAYTVFADELGMDAAEFNACLADQAPLDEVTLDWVDGRGLGVLGTPTFFVNGRRVEGGLPFSVFSLVIDREIEALGLTPPDISAPDNSLQP